MILYALSFKHQCDESFIIIGFYKKGLVIVLSNPGAESPNFEISLVRDDIKSPGGHCDRLFFFVSEEEGVDDTKSFPSKNHPRIAGQLVTGIQGRKIINLQLHCRTKIFR